VRLRIPYRLVISIFFLYINGAFWRSARRSQQAHKNLATGTQKQLWQKLRSGQPNSVQRQAHIRGYDNKKKIKEADFPPEAPESNSHKYEAGDAEHSLHDLSSERLKGSCLAEFKESCDRAKKHGRTKQAEKHRVNEVFQKKLPFSSGS
jgi:hypothetical protein